MDDVSREHAQHRLPILKEGEGVVEVPLSREGRRAIVDRDDFEALVGAGISDQWSVMKARDREYVRVRCPYVKGGATTVARIIMNAPTDLVVRYADGNPFNLRRSNLYFAHSSSYWPKGWSVGRRRSHPRPPVPITYRSEALSQ